MKKIFILIMFCFFTASLTIYAAGDNENNNYQTAEPIEIVSEKTKMYEDICVDVGINGDGYYSMIGDVEIKYSNEEILYIYLDEPTLLSFVVSSKHGNGVWLLDKDDGEKILQNLTTVKEKLKSQGSEELAINIEQIISEFRSNGPITNAST